MRITISASKIGYNGTASRSGLLPISLCVSALLAPVALQGADKGLPFVANVHFNGDASVNDRWEFVQGIPAPSKEERLRGTNQNPYRIEVLENNIFGYLATRGDAGSRVVPTASDSILFFSWRVSANKSNPVDVAPMRLRASAGDGSTAATATFAEVGIPIIGTATDPILVPSDGDFKTLTSAVYVPNEVIDDTGAKGFVMAFDVLNFLKSDGVDTVFTVSDFVAQQVPVASLQGGVDVYSRDFTSNTDDFSDSSLPGYAGGRDVNTSTNGGLKIDPVGGIEIDEDLGDPEPVTGRFPGLSYAYGIWSGDLNGWTVTSNKIYRVDYTLTSGAPSRDRANLVRLRFRAGSAADYVYTTEISSSGESRNQFRPDADGESYTSFVMFPNQQSGMDVRFFLDVYAVDSTDTGAITLKNIHVRSYDMPTLTTP